MRVLFLQQAFIPLSYCHSEFQGLSGDRLRKLNGITKLYASSFFFLIPCWKIILKKLIVYHFLICVTQLLNTPGRPYHFLWIKNSCQQKFLLGRQHSRVCVGKP